MKRRLAVRLLICLTLVAAGLAGGCAYTTVVKDEQKSVLGPRQTTGYKAVMPQVVDKRVWPEKTDEKTVPNVRIFAPEITDLLRKNLVAKGLFKELIPEDSFKSLDCQAKLSFVLSTFNLEKDGRNSWLVPHMLVDGFFMPVFAAGIFVTQGQVDLGGYWIPSTELDASLQMAAVWTEKITPIPVPALPLPGAASASDEVIGQTDKENNKPKEVALNVLTRSYLVDQSMGAFSEKQLTKDFGSYDDYGAELSKNTGQKILSLLVETISRDPHWAYLSDWRVLALAKMYEAGAYRLDQRLDAVAKTFNVFKKLNYYPTDIQILRNGALEADARASIVNGLRVGRLNLESVDQLSLDKKLTEEKAELLFNDPTLEDDQVKAELAQLAFVLVRKVLTPVKQPEVKPDQGLATIPGDQKDQDTTQKALPTGPWPDPPNAEDLRNAFMFDLVKVLADKPVLQELLTQEADKAVGRAWPNMEKLLEKINSPVTKKYLESRQG